MPPCLVLLPGMDGTGDLFEPLMLALGNSMDTVVVRYPESKPLGYAALTSLVRAALPTDKSFVLLGESFSGPIAVTLAAEAPPGLVGLILSASFVATPTPWFRPFRLFVKLVPVGLLVRWFGPRRLLGRFQTPELCRLLLEVVRRVSPNVLHARIRASLEVDVSSALAAVAVPALYLRATEDSIVPQSVVGRFTRIAAHARVVSLEAPHCLLQCVPEDAARVIGDFVTTLSSLR